MIVLPGILIKLEVFEILDFISLHRPFWPFMLFKAKCGVPMSKSNVFDVIPIPRHRKQVISESPIQIPIYSFCTSGGVQLGDAQAAPGAAGAIIGEFLVNT